MRAGETRSSSPERLRLTAGPARLGRTRRRGIAIVYVAVLITLLMGFCSLAVDVGRIQVAKTELRRAADAAGRAAAADLGVSVAQAQTDAAKFAAANTCDGTPVVVSASDVEFGLWNDTNKTFTVLSGTARSTATAVRVTASRTTAKGNSISLFFGSIIGRGTCDVSAQCIARSSTTGFSIVGLNSLTTGNAHGLPKFDSWNSAAGPYTTYPAGSHGNASSNGNITLLSGTKINGDARPGIGKTISSTGSTITGSTAPLTYTLNFPAPVPGPAATTNNNANLPSAYFNSSTRNFSTPSGASLTIPGGTYYVNNVSWTDTTFNFTGPVVFYITGTTFFTQNNLTTTYQNLPANLKFEVVNAATVTYDFDQSCYAVLYAPLSNVTTLGFADDYGAVVGNNLDMTVGWHVDEALAGAGVTGAIVVVK
jgi:Flp pilus assembly protein TadG